MNRVKVLAALMLVGVLSVTLGAAVQQRAGGPPAPMVIEVQKLRNNLFVLTGGGGNTAVFVQANGVTVVDTKNPGWGQPILAKIKELTNKPVTTIINTHTHGDHVSGNVAFPTAVQVVTHANTRTNMEKMKIFGESKGAGLPTRAFADYLALGDGADRVELRYFGRGHTNGDAWVFFPALRVLHTGDIFPGKSLPLLDVNNGGSGVALPRTVSAAHRMTADIDAIITGHSTVMTPADLKEWAEFNDDFLAAVSAGKAAGRSIDEIASSWKMPEKYKGYAEPQPARVRANVEAIYNELR
jgi:glyoxylase-like metal-dependent hydrolase (beta-lactamase superfamily II)